MNRIKNWILILTPLALCAVFVGIHLYRNRELPEAAALSTRSNLPWLTQYSRAREHSQASGKPMLIYFSGLGWCYWCGKLDEEVFSAPEFERFAQENLILLNIDFPRKVAQTASIADKFNADLAGSFGITGVPSLVLVSPDGKTLGKFGYRQGGAAVYIEAIEKALK